MASYKKVKRLTTPEYLEELFMKQTDMSGETIRYMHSPLLNLILSLHCLGLAVCPIHIMLEQLPQRKLMDPLNTLTSGDMK